MKENLPRVVLEVPWRKGEIFAWRTHVEQQVTWLSSSSDQREIDITKKMNEMRRISLLI